MLLERMDLLLPSLAQGLQLTCLSVHAPVTILRWDPHANDKTYQAIALLSFLEHVAGAT